MTRTEAETSQGPRIYGVGEVVAGLRRLLADRVGRLWIVGQVTNLSRPRSGHVYFTLVDEQGQMRAALFRNTARQLAFEPEEGLEVLVYAEVTVYEARGDLQLIVRELSPRGVGALQLAFDQLRRRLEGEGLFDPERKRALPAHPTRLGVVTSPSGAALRDVLEVSGRRQPSLPILLSPTRVQGPGADAEIAAALEALAADRSVSTILLVRGGGSLEDLQAFNTETVARAIAACPVPVVSGVGHEVDVSIADLVADVRAPTPSVAAELAVPDRRSQARELAGAWSRLLRALSEQRSEWRRRVEREQDALRAQEPTARLAAQRERYRAAASQLDRSIRGRADRAEAALATLAGRLDSLSPLAVLGRGYALVRRSRDGAIVREPADAPPGERLAVRVASAEIEARVETVRPANREKTF